MMIYAQSDTVLLVERTADDDYDNYIDWNDTDTQKGFNFIPKWKTFDEYIVSPASKTIFLCTIACKKTGLRVGEIQLSDETPPDISIRIFRPYRFKGYGKDALFLALSYCFAQFHLDTISAGCYEHNEASRKLLLGLGFQRDPENDLFAKDIFSGLPIRQENYIIKPCTLRR